MDHAILHGKPFGNCFDKITTVNLNRPRLSDPAWLLTNQMDLFHNDVKRGKRDVRRNLIGLKRTFIIAEPIKFRVSSWKPRLTSI